MPDRKHPIIARGELYVEPIIKKVAGGPKDIPHDYQSAKTNMIQNIASIMEAVENQREYFLQEKVICIRMEPKFEAKSYVPTQLLVDESMQFVGGRKYSYSNEKDEKQTAKLYFVKTDITGIQTLKRSLSLGTKDRVAAWRDQVGSIYSMDLLLPEEKIMGFSDDWVEGSVEVVLHPLANEYDEMIDMFFHTSGISQDKAIIRTYEDGLTFISAKCAREEVNRLKQLNPLRAVHPLGRVGIPQIRMMPGGAAPQIEHANKKSSITVGVFDGGADEAIPLLNGYVKAIDCVATLPNANYIAHGVGVCGAVLHGNLAGKTKTDILPIPSVSVDSFRVLPIQDPHDFELYEAIDAIESMVKSRTDIKLFNISFGPAGAIVDDSINRFTYALDRLTYDVADGDINPLFCVAAGNDGDLPEPLNRVQSPADMVNGLGIGAYTLINNNSKTRASYSCIGSGREGAKVKPDFLDFGGSVDRPFVLAGTNPGTLSAAAGTSFSSPLALHKIGKLMARSEDIIPHLGRTLLIHSSEVDDLLSKEEQGYGYCTEDADDALVCDDKRVTVLYSGTLEPAQTVRLLIFSPKINDTKGYVNITWTITTIVDPYANDPDAYTNNCIEDVFIPHEMTFNFSKRGAPPKKLNLLKEDHAIQAKALLDEGYRRSAFPASHPMKRTWSESDLRATDLKWDTVIRKGQRMRGASLLNPVLTLHAIGRNSFDAHNIQYHVAITIDAPKYVGSLYDSILQTYQNLTPIEIRNINRVMVNID